MSKRELVDLTMRLHHQTDKAVLVSLDGEREHAVWLPKSAVELDFAAQPGLCIVTLPEQLAIDKELV